ncbi:MAG: B12-binding domain-containing radical SAM protein [Rhodocyclaceae bacterium]|nr:B12-binding domain-containing radical SAM protein [Rhodocyclaceae bacterium]
MHTERLLFIIPPYFNVDDYMGAAPGASLPAFTIPYGLLSMDAYLKAHCQNALDVRILDLNLPLRQAIDSGNADGVLETFDTLVTDTVADFAPTIVGISALFNITFRYLRDMASIVRRAAPTALIVAGGGLPSAGFMHVLDQCPDIDAVCRGEGELPMAALIDADDKTALLDQHASWITRNGLARGKQPAHTFIEELDAIPMLDYDMVRLDDYNNRSIDKRFAGQPKREMAIHTSRGCPFLCVFCSNPSLHGRQVRAMSVERVAREVARMKDEYGLTVLMIEDDHFLFDRDRAKAVLRALAPLKIRIEFPNGIAVYNIDDELASLLGAAGASTVALAVESGSDHVLNKIIKKPLKVGMVKEKVQLLRKYGVQSHVFIVLGLPGEMDEHREQTRQLLLDAGFDWAHIFCAQPIFGSRLHEICVDKGYIDQGEFLQQITAKPIIRAPGVDPEHIGRFAYALNLEVNFVHNFNLREGNLDAARRYFLNVVEKYPDHALGHHALARALDKAGDATGAREAMGRFEYIVGEDPWWYDHARHFGLLDAPGATASTAHHLAA